MALSRITNYIEADGADRNLQSSDTTITDGSVLGVINFKAPSEASGTDSILLASKIEAVAEGTFSASSNATELVFHTASSEAAGTAGGGKLVMSSTGNLILKDTRTADGSSPSITLQTGDTDIAADDILGGIFFQAPDEATGTDAILVGAGIVAATEGDFSSSSNATSLVFRTGASATADDKFQIKSNGDLHLQSDGASFFFGASKEIELRHVADDGLILKHVGTGDGNEPSLTFQAGDNDIAQDDVLGSIFFQAPDEGAGTDAVLVAAGIEAVSEGDFSSSSNATSLIFKTGASETATEKMRLKSDGKLGVGVTPTVQFHVLSSAAQSIATFAHPSSSTAAVNGGALVAIQNTNSTAGNQSSLVFNDSAGEASSGIFGFNTDHSSHEGFMKLCTRNSGGTFAERMRVAADGGVTIQDGDLVIGTAGHGISFAATSDASSASFSELLDDYEEGIAGTTISVSTSGSVTLNSSYNNIRYTKIGRLATLNADIRVSSVSSPNGAFRVNIPFTSLDDDASTAVNLGVVLTHSISMQSDQQGNFVILSGDNLSYLTMQFQTSSTRLGVDASNMGLGANDEIVFSITMTTA